MVQLKEVLIEIVKPIVSDPDSVVVNENVSGKDVLLQLSVAPDDMGKVIGQQGKLAKALRTIVRAATPRNSKKYVIEICERGGDAVDADTADEE